MATTPNRIKITVMPEVDDQAIEQAARSAANLFLATYAVGILDGIQHDEDDDPEDEGVVMACDWSDYRKDYGVSPDDAIRSLEHRAFKAGWTAGRHGDQSGVLR